MGIPAGDGLNQAAGSREGGTPSPPPEGRQSFLTTIVGGRPRPEKQAGGMTLGVERVLLLAAGDEEFKARLLAARAAALDGSGVALTPTERTILLAAPEAQLGLMIARLTPAEPERREFLKHAARTAAAGVLLGLGGLFGEGCGCERPTEGVRPDRPPLAPPKPSPRPPPPATVEPVTQGIRPDRPMTHGISPDRPPEPPPPAPPDEWRLAPGGIRPDRPEEPALPPSWEPAEGGVRPDRPE